MYSGYRNKPDATVEAWSNLWHHTGDMARFDAEGFIHFVDRVKDKLRRRGEMVSSVHIEETLREMPEIADVAVTAVPGSLGDDDIKACVVETDPGALTAQAVFEFLKDRIAYFAIPRYVHIHDVLPTNAMKRVMKERIREEGVPDDAFDLEALGLSVAREHRRAPGMARSNA
jgi:crotonobetaine/carnitine-CoA ligase